MSATDPGWAIYKGRVRYLSVSFSTQSEADDELEDLLRPYPPGHEWRKNLRVDRWPLSQAVALGFDPPYGYRHAESRHGRHLLPHHYEQRVLAIIDASEGVHPSEVAAKLNKEKYHTRERKKFTPAYVARLRKERPTP